MTMTYVFQLSLCLDCVQGWVQSGTTNCVNQHLGSRAYKVDIEEWQTVLKELNDNEEIT